MSLLNKFTNDLVIKAKIDEIYKDGYISVAEILNFKKEVGSDSIKNHNLMTEKGIQNE